MDDNITNAIFQVDNVLVSAAVLTECFCCDLKICKGRCCVEGTSGAPVNLDEVMELESSLDDYWPYMSATAQSVVDSHGVAYTDSDGDLVTSIVGGKDCIFTCYDGDCCLCSIERANCVGRTFVEKPVSCALYPLRVKDFGDGLFGITYHRWSICQSAVDKGRKLGLPLYVFLREPLIRRFGDEWYGKLVELADELSAGSIS